MLLSRGVRRRQEAMVSGADCRDELELFAIIRLRDVAVASKPGTVEAVDEAGDPNRVFFLGMWSLIVAVVYVIDELGGEIRPFDDPGQSDALLVLPPIIALARA